jgi:ABC-2 type transport system permease protein
VVELAGIYRRLIGARVRAQFQYRTSLVLDILGAFATGFIDFIAILVLFDHLLSMGGFTVGEVAFLFAMTTITFALVDMFIGQLDDLPRMIRTGTLDTFLTRPLGSLFQVVSSDFSVRRLGRVAQGFVVLAYALGKVDIGWDVGRIAMMPVMIVSGAAIFGGVWVAVVCISFWFVDAREASNAFTYGGNFLTQFPLGIFEKWLRRLLGFVIPMSFVVYFPSLYILDKPDPLGLPHGLRFIAPLVGVASVAVGRTVWGIAVRHYRSTGS